MEQKNEKESPKKSLVISCIMIIITICLIGGIFMTKHQLNKMAEQSVYEALEKSKNDTVNDNKTESNINNQQNR